MELDPSELGTLDLDGAWVPYADLQDADFMPARLHVGKDEYAYSSSIIIMGHGALLTQRIPDIRGSGKEPIIVERGDRYYVFVTPP